MPGWPADVKITPTPLSAPPSPAPTDGVQRGPKQHHQQQKRPPGRLGRVFGGYFNRIDTDKHEVGGNRGGGDESNGDHHTLPTTIVTRVLPTHRTTVTRSTRHLDALPTPLHTVPAQPVPVKPAHARDLLDDMAADVVDDTLLIVDRSDTSANDRLQPHSVSLPTRATPDDAPRTAVHARGLLDDGDNNPVAAMVDGVVIDVALRSISGRGIPAPPVSLPLIENPDMSVPYPAEFGIVRTFTTEERSVEVDSQDILSKKEHQGEEKGEKGEKEEGQDHTLTPPVNVPHPPVTLPPGFAAFEQERPGMLLSGKAAVSSSGSSNSVAGLVTATAKAVMGAAVLVCVVAVAIF